jgi:hypothetical protein
MPGPHTGPSHDRSILDTVGFPDSSVMCLFKAATFPSRPEPAWVKSLLVHELENRFPVEAGHR